MICGKDEKYKGILIKYTETSSSEIFSTLSVKYEVSSCPGYKKKSNSFGD